jgi:dethiobiotin synthetase
MEKGLFITGTDTGVGKTHVGSVIARAFVVHGIDVGVMKPAETGCRQQRGLLVPSDAMALMAATKVNDALGLVNPYRFRRPLAPAVAAEQEGIEIRLARILSAYHTLAKRHRYMLVEGAGGIMVPLNRRTTYLDLAARLRLPVLIVARPDLGTINHTMLTVMALRSRDIAITGIIVNDAKGGPRTIADRTNPPVIERMTGIPVLGILRYGQKDLPMTTLGKLGFDAKGRT